MVTDRDRGRLVRAAGGRSGDTLRKFFDDLGDERAALLTHVPADTDEPAYERAGYVKTMRAANSAPW